MTGLPVVKAMGGKPDPQGDDPGEVPIKPLSIVGSCAHCPCGERVEVPLVGGVQFPQDVAERILIVNGQVVAVRCATCRVILALDDDILDYYQEG